MELALLMLVPGRLGGPGSGPALPLLALLLMAGGATSPLLSGGGALPPILDENPSTSEDTARVGGPDPWRGE